MLKGLTKALMLPLLLSLFGCMQKEAFRMEGDWAVYPAKEYVIASKRAMYEFWPDGIRPCYFTREDR